MAVAAVPSRENEVLGVASRYDGLVAAEGFVGARTAWGTDFLPEWAGPATARPGAPASVMTRSTKADDHWGPMKTRLLWIVLSSFLVSSCAVSSPSPRVQEPVVVGGNSQFTPAGIEGIKRSQAAVFDLTHRPLQMSQLGLGEASDGAMLATDADRPITVSMTTPTGVVKMETNTIRIRPGADHAVNHIDIFVTHPDVPAANQELRKAADELGFAALRDAEPFGAASTGSSRREKWYPGFGSRTGTVYSVEIYSAPDTGRATFIYSAHLAAKFYTPEAAAKIEATGKP